GSLGSVTILDAAAGTYQYTPHAEIYGEDYFQFEVTDEEGAVSNVATISVTIVQASESFVIELGEVNVNSNWSLVEFSEPFVDPIVVAKPASSNDKNPCVVRIRNLTASGFEIRVQNWNYLPDTHGYETVSFITLERGSHVLSDGTMIEAGSFETDKVGTFVPVIYAGDFNVAPVVAASIVSYNGGDAVDGRIRKTSNTGFEYTMQEQEVNPKSHVFESVTYIAWEPSAGFAGDLVYQIGATGDVVTDAWHTLDFSEAFEGAPVLIADMQTTDGGDSANLRYNELDVNSVQLKIAEEQSKDSETAHTTENIGFMAFSQVNLIGDPHLDGLTTKDELELYDTNPWAVDSDQDGLDDGDELSYWGLNWDADFDQDGLVNLMDADADGDGYSDGVEVLRLFDPADAGSHPDAPVVEAGVVSVSSTWQRIHFTEIFINPVIVAKAVSKNDEDSAVVRIRNVDVDGFDISVQEWDYLDGIHGEESVGYLVVESGSYSLPDGTKVEAGQLSAKEVSSFAQIKFKRQFNVVPVVTASVVSMNETEAVTGRMKDISLTGFGLKLQEQEANALLHAEETVSFIAWEPSSGTINGLSFEVNRTADSVNHKSVNVDLTAGFTETPVILADMQTTDGGDTSLARIDNCLPDSCSLWIEEEQSRDSEVDHTSEVVGYMAITGR
ncbi:MAG: cadherin-like domain-containing protein, partial [Desulfobulbaceae bacterium]|nr:cadherin-like domain-containing protein [Desulfobulbaceae bacterium]